MSSSTMSNEPDRALDVRLERQVAKVHRIVARGPDHQFALMPDLAQSRRPHRHQRQHEYQSRQKSCLAIQALSIAPGANLLSMNLPDER